MNTFYEYVVHEPELRELDMSLALECLTGLARRRRKAYNRRAGLENISAMLCMEDATMPRAKQASKRKRGTKAVPALGAAGLTMSLVGGASAAAVPTQDVPRVPNVAPSHEIMLGEEEISDVSLATFHVFDKENTGSLRGMVQEARGCGRCGGCRVCRGCRGCRGCGCGGCGGGGACCASWGACRFC